LLRTARMYERETDWHLQRPAICEQSGAGV
jgi:hypothetical protein